MATINIPGRAQGENWRLKKIEGNTNAWLDLTFSNDRTGKEMFVKLSANETYRIVNHQKEEIE